MMSDGKEGIESLERLALNLGLEEAEKPEVELDKSESPLNELDRRVLALEKAAENVETTLRRFISFRFDEPNTASQVERLKRLLATVAVVIFLLTAIVGLVTRRIVAPVRRLTRVSSTLADDVTGEFQPLPISSGDEIGVLTASFNRMILERQEDRKNLEARVLERTEALSQARFSTCQPPRHAE